MNKISVITVVYNDKVHIRETMESFFSQSWEDKEYIVIDGGSTDGTADIVEEYSDRLAYWCSEKDEGIYDAMNKGIAHANGQWINILNCGDYYCSASVLENMIRHGDVHDADVIYGNGIWFDDNKRGRFDGAEDIRQMELNFAFRHGCSLIRTSVHKKYLYDISKRDKFDWALDYDALYRMYYNGCKFVKVNVDVQLFELNGISNNQLQSLKYNHKITTQFHRSLKKDFYYLYQIMVYYLNKVYLYKWMKKVLLHK